MGFVEKKTMDIIFENTASNSTVGMRQRLPIIFVYVEVLTVYDMES